MNKPIVVITTLAILGGCASTEPLPQNTIEDTSVEYPEITYPKLSVEQDSQMVTASNHLADALGVEFVEWTKELNPYDFHLVRNTTIKLTYDDPQKAFLALFDRSGLLPVYDEFHNTVTIYPYSMNQRINTPHIFTPKFTRSQIQKEEVQRQYKEDLAKNRKALEYNYYRGYSVRETLSAWTEHAGYNGAIYYFNTRPHKNFLASKLETNDSSIAASDIGVMTEFIRDELDRQNLSLPISITKDAPTNKLIFHPFSTKEKVTAYEVQTTTVKDNLRQMADHYGYRLIYKATDYRIDTGFTTVLTNYIKPSIEAFLTQYPLRVETVESSKELVIRGK